MLTKFQHQYLKNLIIDKAHNEKVDRIIFAVTSADHSNTRRNPVPLYLRTMAIAKFVQENVEYFNQYLVKKETKILEHVMDVQN